VKTVPETQEAVEAGSNQDDKAMLKTLLQENEPFSKQDELQDLFGAEEKVHQCLSWFKYIAYITQQLLT
jgi:hypothetical protein